MNFKRVSRLWRTVPALWATWWFIRENAHALEFITRHLIRNGLQGARVERARDAVTAIGAAVEKRFEVHARDGAVFSDAGLNVHQNGMPPAMTIEDLFARERTLHWPAGNHRQLRN